MHLLVPVRVVERRRVMTKDDEPKPFLLIARCRAKPENVDAYVAAARVADEGVRASEPGMLHHTFVRDPDDACAFAWSEVYADADALLFHLENPPLVEFVARHEALGDRFSIEVYGTLDAVTKAKFSATGFPIKYFDRALGYSRLG